MAGPKDQTNSQWGRTDEDGGANVTPETGDNFGREPLVDRFGRIFVVAGPAIPGAPSFPFCVGVEAQAEAPDAVADGTCTEWYGDLEGRGQVNHELIFAGEDLIHNVQAVVIEPLASEQHSMDLNDSGVALLTNQIIKTSPGRMYSSRMLVGAGIGTNRWLHFLNKTTAAVNGDEPIWRAALPSQALEVADEPIPGGLFFDTGIVVAISTTFLTTTLPGAAEAIFHIGFK